MTTHNESATAIAERINAERMNAVRQLEEAIRAEREAEAQLSAAQAESRRAAVAMERAGWSKRELAQMGVGKAPARRRRSKPARSAATPNGAPADLSTEKENGDG